MYELPRGSVVGKYEIMRRLAVGGMAEIYLARVTGAAGFEKLVVLKRILPSVAEDPTFVQMFLDEARLAATLRHPNIADVYDVGEDAGTYFFTMEYVYGQDVRALRHEVKKGADRIPLNVALAVVHGAASALDHAHEKLGADGKPLHLVHRDVSASNIMVSYDGAVKLLDFGIARASSSTHKTQIGTLKGKIAYMSPEQCRGMPLDRRSDLFSLGTVLYELTVGRRPFRGDSDFAVMDQIVYQGATPPSQVVANYPLELEAIVMKLLERTPNLRYPTGEDLLHELDDFIAKHGLWMSPRAIGKYMRTLFADKIEAWEQAEQQGVPFAQHVAQSITSQSQRSELLTPPSSFPGLPPRTTSQQMAAVQAEAGRRMSSPMPAMQPLLPVEPAPLPVAIARDAQAESEPFARVDLSRESAPFAKISDVSAPVLRPRSGRTILFAFLGALVLGTGIVVGFMLSKSDTPAPPAAPAAVTEEPPRQMQESVEKPEPAKPEPAKPEPAKPAEAAPPVHAAEPQPAVEPPPAKPQKPIVKPVVKKPAGKPNKPKPEPKEQTWDPNSPFLPH